MKKVVIWGIGIVVLILAVAAATPILFLLLIRHSHVQQMAASQITIGGTNSIVSLAASPEPPPALPRINLPAVVVDSRGYGTENNWLAHNIALRIASLSYLASHPGTSLPSHLSVETKFDGSTGRFDLNVTGLGEPIVAKLQPIFIWDPDGYGFARFSGRSDPFSPHQIQTPPSGQPSAVLSDLLNLTGPELAKIDGALSAQLQSDPKNPALHTQAALLLVALALRDQAAEFTDYRQILCRATAHLAFAKAVSDGQNPSWEGAIADAGVRALAGRESEALSECNTLVALRDVPEAAKVWLDALRLRATGDWRSVQVTASSPLLLKIVWAHVLADDLPDLVASKKLDDLGRPEVVPDWGRCALNNASGVPFTVETGNRYAEGAIKLELDELNQELRIEKAAPVDEQSPGKSFASSLQETLFSGEPPALHIIGPEIFRDVTRRHLLSEIEAESMWLAHQLGFTDKAAQFEAETLKRFEGMRQLETVQFIKGPQEFEPMRYADKLTALHQANIQWEPWELPMSKFPHCPDLIYPDFHTLHAFYADGLPYGTAYDLDHRATYSLNNAKLLADDAEPTIYHEANPNVASPGSSQLQPLAPDSFPAMIAGVPVSDAIQKTKKLWDYSIAPMQWIETSAPGFLSDEDQTLLAQKYMALDPDFAFAWAAKLRNDGKMDEAAAADRDGFEHGYDRILMSNSVGALVDYDLAHGKQDEALSVAQQAAQVGSQSGLHLNVTVLEKLNRLDEAEGAAQQISQRYGDSSDLLALYAGHPEHFEAKSAEVTQQIFPKGMSKVTLADFNGQPTAGCVFNSDSDLLQQGGLQVGDVVVAFDSYRIENTAQYNYVRGLSDDPHMHLIIWRNGHYVQMTTSAPDRRFQVELDEYPPKTGT